MRHAVQNLMADDMLLLPASATVHVQAAEIRTGEVCGVDMTPVNQHRWHPGYLSGVPLAPTPCGKGDGPWRGGGGGPAGGWWGRPRPPEGASVIRRLNSVVS